MGHFWASERNANAKTPYFSAAGLRRCADACWAAAVGFSLKCFEVLSAARTCKMVENVGNLRRFALRGSVKGSRTG
jgi:hypothetical protein